MAPVSPDVERARRQRAIGQPRHRQPSNSVSKISARPANCLRQLLSWRGLRWCRVFSRIDEQIMLQAVLPVVQLTIPATHGDELAMSSALDDLSAFQHQDLIR